jgi:hypothetical protein
MGIVNYSVEALVYASTFCKNKRRALMLGRQNMFIDKKMVEQAFKTHGYTFNHEVEEYAENIFTSLGFETIDSMDATDYEKCTIVQDMNKPLSTNTKYDFIFDGGTTEHIFNIPQCFQNIIDLLDEGGVICHAVPNNNMSGHGFYQFSPEIYMMAYSEKYGMEYIESYLTQEAKPNSKLPLKHVVDCVNTSYRETSKFNDNDEVIVISISKKINKGQSIRLVDTNPIQYSYSDDRWGNSKLQNNVMNINHILLSVIIIIFLIMFIK